MSRLLRMLDRHWFSPASLRDLALVRIVCVGAQLLLFFRPFESQLYFAQADRSLFVALPALKILMLPLGGWGIRPEPMFLHAVWIATFVAGIGALIGLYTRLSLLVFAAGNTLLIAHVYSYGELHHTEAALVITLWLLALAPSGGAWSVDELRARLRFNLRGQRFEPRKEAEDESPDARWPLRVVQWLLVLIYLSAGMSKLAKSGFDWFNGYTLAYYFAQDGLRNDIDLGMWLSSYPKVTALLSIFSGLFEFTFALAILVPRSAWAYVLAGTGFHTGIYLTQRAPFFQFVFLYVVFAESLRQVMPAWLRGGVAESRRLTVVYDGLCPLCIRSMTILDFFDTGRRLSYLDLEAEHARVASLAPGVTPWQTRAAMHVLGPDGRAYRGFFAFRELARVLPPFWPLLPLLHLPFMDRIGSRVYDRVAEHRARTVCRAATCRIAEEGDSVDHLLIPPAVPETGTTVSTGRLTG